MNKIRFTLNATAALVILLAASSMANAQATRTWVSGVGDDVNPCSRTAPCKTFAGAISKTAAGGEISVLDPGGFGAVTITKSITIDGGGIRGSILAASVNGVIVNLPAATDKVILRNLSINGAGSGINGIRFIQNGRLYVEDCTIFGFNSGRGIDFAPTALNTVLSVRNTSIREINGAGVGILPAAGASAKASFDNVVVERTQNGFVINDTSGVVIHNSRIAHSVSSGVLVSGSASGDPDVFIESSVISNNGTNGIRSQGTATTEVRLSNNAITGNATGVSIANTAKILSFGNNHNDGNTANGAVTPGNLPLQ